MEKIVLFPGGEEKRRILSRLLLSNGFFGPEKSTYIRGVPKSEFSGSPRKGGKGEAERGEVVGERTGPECESALEKL